MRTEMKVRKIISILFHGLLPCYKSFTDPESRYVRMLHVKNLCSIYI